MKLAGLLALVAFALLFQSIALPERREATPGRWAAPLYLGLTLCLLLVAVAGAAGWLGGLEPEWRPAAAAGVVSVVGMLAAAWLLWARGVRAREAARRSLPIDRWRKEGLGVQPSQGIVRFGEGQQCPMCHVAHQPTSDAAECTACRALFHLPCAADLGRCSTLGCAGRLVRVDAVRADAVATPPTAFSPARRPEGRRGPPAR